MQAVNPDALARALDKLPYAVSATILSDGGFEKTTRSSFGQFGTLAAQFAPETQAR